LKKVILIGAGIRGQGYTNLMAEQTDFQVVAVAEPIEERRLYVQEKHRIPDERCFESWEGLLALGKIADVCIVATMDREHTAPALAAMKAGYDLLLEKPTAPTPEECVLIEQTAQAHGRFVLVCHVLRYTPFFRLLKKLIDDGEVGQVVNIQHNEGVGHLHQSHSYVRGNWGNSDRSAPMILAKSCHDMDILQWLMGEACTKVQSFGTLSHFTRDNAPAGAPEFCIEGCPVGESCVYNAVKLYLHSKSNWFRCAATKRIRPTDADVERAIRTTNYGRCVYQCDNNVVDHQVVNLEFENRATATFSMCAFNQGSRTIRIMGTKGEIMADMGDDFVSLFRFSSGAVEKIIISEALSDQSIVGGHGGGDGGIVRALATLGDKHSPYRDSLCDISTATRNHMIAFAAEESRLSGQVVDMQEFMGRF